VPPFRNDYASPKAQPAPRNAGARAARDCRLRALRARRRADLDGQHLADARAHGGHRVPLSRADRVGEHAIFPLRQRHSGRAGGRDPRPFTRRHHHPSPALAWSRRARRRSLSGSDRLALRALRSRGQHLFGVLGLAAAGGNGAPRRSRTGVISTCSKAATRRFTSGRNPASVLRTRRAGS